VPRRLCRKAELTILTKDGFVKQVAPREFYIAFDKNDMLLGVSIKDNMFYGTTNLIKVREVIE